MEYRDMPKLESPFERELINKKYVCIPKIKEDFRWIFTDEAIAVEKLDGTNTSLWIRSGKPFAIMNRTNFIDIWDKRNLRFIEGITEAIDRNYVVPELCNDGPQFGELLGPKIQRNPYQLEKHIFLPLNYLREHYYYKFWNEFVSQFHAISDEKMIFDEVSNLFKGLWSLYKRKRGMGSDVNDVNENTTFEGLAAEGIVFYRKGYENDYTSCCKLRRDMFDWFKGRGHKL